MRFFGLKTCDTCRKARKALDAAGLTYEAIDVRADGLSAEDVAAIAQNLGDAAINRASTTWRGLSTEDRDRPVADLLAGHPTVMKRPVIEADGNWTAGWGPKVQAALLP